MMWPFESTGVGEVVRQPGLGHRAKRDELLLAALAPDPVVAVGVHEPRLVQMLSILRMVHADSFGRCASQ